ncbi:MAG TPA: hypothetical protein PKK15_07590 [Kouleothrix sp.]|nr:hypothetical protein [Kouleothrix sp.]
MSNAWIDPGLKAAASTPIAPPPLDGLVIRMGVLDYTVRVERDVRSSDDAKLYGEIRYGAGTIRVDADITPAFQAVVLWHELVHGLLEQAGQEQSEATCNSIAFGVVQLLRDNPNLAALTVATLTPKDNHGTE